MATQESNSQGNSKSEENTAAVTDVVNKSVDPFRAEYDLDPSKQNIVNALSPPVSANLVSVVGGVSLDELVSANTSTAPLSGKSAQLEVGVITPGPIHISPGESTSANNAPLQSMSAPSSGVIPSLSSASSAHPEPELALESGTNQPAGQMPLPADVLRMNEESRQIYDYQMRMLERNVMNGQIHDRQIPAGMTIPMQAPLQMSPGDAHAFQQVMQQMAERGGDVDQHVSALLGASEAFAQLSRNMPYIPQEQQTQDDEEQINNLMHHLDLGTQPSPPRGFPANMSPAAMMNAMGKGPFPNPFWAGGYDMYKGKPRFQKHSFSGPQAMKTSVRLPMRPGQPDCQYFLRTGRCAYADKCRYTHRQSLRSLLLENIANGDCLEYIMTGFCKYKQCKYNHNQKRRRDYMIKVATLLNDEQGVQGNPAMEGIPYPPMAMMPPMDGHMPGQMMDGHMPGQMMEGHMPGQMMDGHMPGQMMEGHMPGQMMEGHMPGRMMEGHMPGPLMGPPVPVPRMQKPDCLHFAANGTCPHGDNCKFNHPAVPSQQQPAGSYQPR